MASFKAVLQVAGNQYEIRYSEFNLWQFTDELGRPASPTLGGGFVLDIEEPPKGDSLLFEWAISPVMQLNGQVVFWDLEGKMLKVIKFHHAFLVSLRGAFDGSGQGSGGPSKQTQLTISPQAVDNNGQLHDNNWPAPDPIVDWDWSAMNQQCNPDAIKPEHEPSALSEGLHTLLDVVGMIPVVGELADGANALIYAAEGDHVNAAMSAAAMIPIVGNVATGAKWTKRGAKLIDKVRGLKKAQKALGKVSKRVRKVASELEIIVPKKDKIDRKLLDPPKTIGQAPTFKKDGTKVEIHHQGQKREGPFKEMHWEDHRGKGNDKINHPNKGEPSQVDRGEFNRAKKKYWKKEFPKNKL